MNRRQPDIRVQRVLWVIGAIALYIALVGAFGLSPATESLYSSDIEWQMRYSDQVWELPESDSFTVSLILNPPSLTDPGSFRWSYVRIDGISYYSNTPTGDQHLRAICIDEIVVEEFLQGFLRGYAQTFFDDADYPLCVSVDAARKSPLDSGHVIWFDAFDSEDSWVTRLYQVPNHLLYPYDDFQLVFCLQVTYRLIYDDSTIKSTAYPAVSIFVPGTAGWHISSSEVELDPPLSDLDRVMAVDLRRPLLEKIVQPSMVAVVLFFIFVLTLVDSTGAFIEGAVAVFFGIFAIKEILMPPNVAVRTLLDYATWGLYFAFGGALLHRLTYIWRQVLNKGRSQPPVTKPPANLETQAPLDSKGTLEDNRHLDHKIIGIALAILGSLLALAWLRARLRR